jgi:hypothetical protein
MVPSRVKVRMPTVAMALLSETFSVKSSLGFALPPLPDIEPPVPPVAPPVPPVPPEPPVSELPPVLLPPVPAALPPLPEAPPLPDEPELPPVGEPPPAPVPAPEVSEPQAGVKATSEAASRPVRTKGRVVGISIVDRSLLT